LEHATVATANRTNPGRYWLGFCHAPLTARVVRVNACDLVYIGGGDRDRRPTARWAIVFSDGTQFSLFR